MNKFVEAFIEKHGNLSTKDFTNNGYSFEQFLTYSQCKLSYEEQLRNLILAGVLSLQPYCVDDKCFPGQREICKDCMKFK
jgi:hypothetical protein